MRLDNYLFENKLTDSRTRAKNLIEIKRVTVNGKIIIKPSFDVKGTEEIFITEDYAASLGSLKLEKAVKDFSLDVKDRICLDVGAANGGFSDILLNNGAKKVYALDIGECALPKRLINDSRIVVMDKTNARNIVKNDFSDEISLCVIDVSFISLKLVLPAVFSVICDKGEVIALIKPQFELNKKILPKSGVVHDKKVRQSVINDVTTFAVSLGFTVLSVTEAPHPFADKNQEYLVHLKK